MTNMDKHSDFLIYKNTKIWMLMNEQKKKSQKSSKTSLWIMYKKEISFNPLPTRLEQAFLISSERSSKILMLSIKIDFSQKSLYESSSKITLLDQSKEVFSHLK